MSLTLYLALSCIPHLVSASSEEPGPPQPVLASLAPAQQPVPLPCPTSTTKAGLIL